MISLWLGRTSLKKVETVLNLKNDNIKMFNEDVDITTLFNGHGAIKILLDETCNFDDTEKVLIFQEDETDKSKFYKIITLHNQFGYASENNLESLLKRTDALLTNITDTLNKVVSQCETHQQYEKPITTPAVRLPKASEFIAIVAMDLH